MFDCPQLRILSVSAILAAGLLLPHPKAWPSTEKYSYSQRENERRQRSLEEQIARQEQQLQRRLTVLYKINRQGHLARLLFDAQDMEQLRGRISALRQIVRRDRRELKLFIEERQRLQDERRRLIERQAVAERPDLSSGADASDAVLQRGRLPSPVRGVLLRRFSATADSTDHREATLSHHGLSWSTDGPQPVRSVAGGAVRFAGPMPGLGSVVIVEHAGQHFTVYGSLGQMRVRAGEKIEAGKILGNSGLDQLVSQYILYFELRRGAEAIDPAPWLSAL